MEHTYVIAEAGVNHNGSLEMALQLVDAAVEAGADAVKFQTFRAESLVTRQAKKADYQKKTTNLEENQFEMLQRLELNEEEHVRLYNYAKGKGIDFLSTPFDVQSADFLINSFSMPYLKISSGDITNAQLLYKAASARQKIIISTGMCLLSEIEQALQVLAYGFLHSTPPVSSDDLLRAYLTPEGRRALKEKVTILHCTTEYPCPLEEVNLRAMLTIREAFGMRVGYSDHTDGIAVPVAAVALGASVIEKHFTLDRELPGPDHKASLLPGEMKDMITSIRNVELALGNSEKIPTSSEMKNRNVARKSIVASGYIAKGDQLSEGNITVKRPAEGLSALKYWDIINKVASRDYQKDEPIHE